MKEDTMWKGIEALELCQEALEAIVEKAGIDRLGFTACRNLEHAEEEARLAFQALSRCKDYEALVMNDDSVLTKPRPMSLSWATRF